MQVEEVNQNHLFLSDTWEALEYLQRKHLKVISQDLSSSFEEVKNFLDLLIDENEIEKISLQEYSNIDQIIDKLKGS
ncbi:MAG: hypothetical protein WC879_11540 [Melioribacteraceae bacterium]